LFLFAGHDTNISILVLHKYPSVLKQVCDELTTIFGPEVQPTFVAARLGNEPALVNRVPYTQAITREIMRLYLPAGAFGDGAPNVDVVNFHGTRHPTEGCVISLVHCAIHYSQRVWNSSKECLPERWLLEASYELYRQVKHSRI
jgi:cytochrome P450